jgi:WD40 repeat protein
MVLQIFDASDWALGPEDEAGDEAAPDAAPVDVSPGKLVSPGAKLKPSPISAPSPLLPPPVGLVAPAISPRAIQVVKTPIRRAVRTPPARVHPPAATAVVRKVESPTGAGSESLRELRSIVARHEQLIKAQQRAIAELEATVGRLLVGGDERGGQSSMLLGLTVSPSTDASSAGGGLAHASRIERRGSPLSASRLRAASPRASAIGRAVEAQHSSPNGRKGYEDIACSYRYSVHGHTLTGYAPTEWTASDAAVQPARAPDVSPQLEHVYGYKALTPGLGVGNPLVVVSPDIVVYAAARLAVVLDSSENTQVFYSKHDDDVLCIAAAPPAADGTIVLASGECGRRPLIHVWSLAGCEQLVVLPDTQHERGIGMLAFSPDGQLLTSCGVDSSHTLVVWNWRRGVQLASVRAHSEPVYAMAFNPLEPNVLSMACHKAYKVFRFDVPLAIASGAAPNAAPPLAITKRTGVFGKLGCALGGQPQTPLCVAYTPDGHAATGCASGDVLVWSGTKVVTKLRGAHEAPVLSIAVVVGAGLVSGDKQGVLALWSSSFMHVLSRVLENRQEGCDLPAIRSICALGPRAAATAAAAAQPPPPGAHEIEPGSILLGCSDGSIRELDLTSGDAQVWMQAHGQGALAALAVDPTEPSRFASCAHDRTVRVWCAKNRWPIASCTLSEEPCTLDWSPDGSQLAVGLLNGSVLLLKANSLEPLASVKRHDECVLKVAFSPDGQALACGCKDGGIDILAVPGLALVGTCKGHTAAVLHLDWSADGLRLQSDSADLEHAYWSMPLGGHPMSGAACRDVQWATHTCVLGWGARGIWDGDVDILGVVRSGPALDVLATVDDVGRVRLLRWPAVRDGAAAVIALGHSSHVTSALFSTDDELLFTSGRQDCCVMQWRVVR